ncbi:V-type proton ATPase subunit H [[Candida] jaroonii]|uniref:V-type proton ATPase subunit H n=1 Tax=[Candida] jaroonii TaxID=467808 RepID=A0ACA9Y9D4_9ASCO|nr:V-type proton ATPase subunit H [[Candida] jaroonii]
MVEEVESQYLSDQKKIIRERIIPWEGLARANIINEDESNYIKILEKQSNENKLSTVSSQIKLYSNTLLNLLNKLDINSRDDVIKHLLVLINDLIINLPEFSAQLNGLNDTDSFLPFEPFLKHLDNNDIIIKNLSLYNVVLLINEFPHKEKLDSQIIVKIYSKILSLIDSNDVNLKFLNIQILNKLIVNKTFKSIFIENLEFDNINHLIETSNNESMNSNNLQLMYNTLLTIWILSFSAKFNKKIIVKYPQLIGNLLVISKNSIKLKIIRLSISILKNFITICDHEIDSFKFIKIILFNDGLNIITNLKSRKFSSNGSDEELTNDLNDVNDKLIDIVKNKLTSFDEYLTELENPKLLNWNSPTHKSNEFWLENCNNFKKDNYKLILKMFDILSNDSSNMGKIIILNDLQYLINNLGNELVSFINENKKFKLLIMEMLDNSSDNELKYQSLKTIQLLVGHY